MDNNTVRTSYVDVLLIVALLVILTVSLTNIFIIPYVRPIKTPTTSVEKVSNSLEYYEYYFNKTITIAPDLQTLRDKYRDETGENLQSFTVYCDDGTKYYGFRDF